MDQPAKSVKREMRRLAAAAHEEELRRALLPVAAAFEEWRAGQAVSSLALDLSAVAGVRRLLSRQVLRGVRPKTTGPPSRWARSVESTS
jgi:hypothetical protein